MASGKVSKEYPWVLIRERFPHEGRSGQTGQEAVDGHAPTSPRSLLCRLRGVVHRTKRPGGGGRDAVISGQDVDRD